MARRARLGSALIAIAAPLLASGYQVLGPTAMAAGRGSYNEVIARTNAEQLLLTMVRLRYADPIAFLSVTSVTASLKFGANAGAEFGVGPQSNYSGNLVPLSAGVSYEDSPTISYAPVTGQAFVRDWLSPLSLELIVLMLEGAHWDPSLIGLLVARMNDLVSPLDGTVDDAAMFNRACELLSQLARAGVTTWGRVAGTTDTFELVIIDRDGSQRAAVDELLRLLDIPHPTTKADAPIRVPLTASTRVPGQAVLAIRSNSVAQLLQKAASSVEVPPDHVTAGIVAASPPSSSADAVGVAIRSSATAPKRGAVSVQHRGSWYYIDDADLLSKRNFQRIEMLFAMRLAEAQKGTQTAPVLTIPVG